MVLADRLNIQAPISIFLKIEIGACIFSLSLVPSSLVSLRSLRGITQRLFSRFPLLLHVLRHAHTNRFLSSFPHSFFLLLIVNLPFSPFSLAPPTHPILRLHVHNIRARTTPCAQPTSATFLHALFFLYQLCIYSPLYNFRKGD